MRLVPPLPICNDAEFSLDGLERLWLSRKVADTGPVGLIIGLNPSTAGATENDATIRKEIGFAKQWGWSGFWKGNLFTRIETVSTKLKNMSCQMAIGEHGVEVLDVMIRSCDPIVVCWGSAVPKHMTHRIREVHGTLRGTRCHATGAIMCFGLSKDGSPKHPLYLGYDTPMTTYKIPDSMGSIRRRGDG